MFKPKDKVIGKIKPFTGKVGVVKHVDGSYIDVQFKGTRHIVELYPNELEHATEK